MRGSFLFVAASAGAYVLTPGRISSGTKQQQRADTMMVKQAMKPLTLPLASGVAASGGVATFGWLWHWKVMRR